jgi:hypothetical protein
MSPARSRTARRAPTCLSTRGRHRAASRSRPPKNCASRCWNTTWSKFTADAAAGQGVIAFRAGQLLEDEAIEFGVVGRRIEAQRAPPPS